MYVKYKLHICTNNKVWSKRSLGETGLYESGTWRGTLVIMVEISVVIREFR